MGVAIDERQLRAEGREPFFKIAEVLLAENGGVVGDTCAAGCELMCLSIR